MKSYKIALLGFGNVGKALARLLIEKSAELAEKYAIEFKVTGIATGKHGMAINRDGISLEQALSLANAQSIITGLGEPIDCSNVSEFIAGCGADILFESIPVNYYTGQPALDYLRQAIKLGKVAITANKGPVVHGYKELIDLARQSGGKFYFESSVMDGAPIFSLFRRTLPAAQLLGFEGILNSTTNLILGLMEAGATFDQAVKRTQELGLAETDASGDIDGWDAAVKVAALASVLMDIPLLPTEVERTGIREISTEDIAKAKEQGKRWKLVCSAKREGDKLSSQVKPQLVSIDSILYNINGSSSVIIFNTDVLSGLTVVEQDPTPSTTAYGMLADFINAVRE